MPTTEPTTPLGEIIEQRRLELGLTKSEAARRAGVSRGTWHEVEAGRRSNMLADTLNLFDKALGWERGQLRRLSRPLEGRPDLVYTSPEGQQHAVYVKPSGRSDPDQAVADRQWLAALAVTLPAEQIGRVRRLIETDLNAGDSSAGVAGLVEVTEKLDEILRRLDERTADDQPRRRDRPAPRRERSAPRGDSPPG